MKVSLFSLFCSRITIICLTLLFGLITVPQAQPQDESIEWYSMEKAQAMAQENGKKVLIFAEATWCVYCKKMRQQVFPDPAVIDSMNTYFMPVTVDIESEQPMVYNGTKITQRQFAQRNRVQATPTFFFLDYDGSKLGAQPGFIPAETFSRLLGFIGSDAYKEMEFKKYLNTYVSQQ